MTTKQLNIATLTVWLILATIVAGQQKKHKIASTSGNGQVATEPSPELHKLDYFLGTWKELVHGAQSGRTVDFTATEQIEWLPGHTILIARIVFKNNIGQTLSTYVGFRTYDSQLRRYTVHGCDSSGWEENGAGSIDGGVWSWDVHGKRGMINIDTHQVLTRDRPDHYTEVANVTDNFPGKSQLTINSEHSKVEGPQSAYFSHLQQVTSKRYYQSAIVAMQRNDWSAANSALYKAIAIAPENADLHLSLAIADFNLGNMQVAQSELTEARCLGLPTTKRQASEELERKLGAQLGEQSPPTRTVDLTPFLGNWHYRLESGADGVCTYSYDLDEWLEIFGTPGSSGELSVRSTVLSHKHHYCAGGSPDVREFTLKAIGKVDYVEGQGVRLDIKDAKCSGDCNDAFTEGRSYLLHIVDGGKLSRDTIGSSSQIFGRD